MENPATGVDSPKPGNQIDRIHKSIEVSQSNGPDDLKVVSDLSTLLVATIQEAKDRISEVEYIFCSQLHPAFQKCSKPFKELYEMARKVAEEEGKELKLMMIDRIKELHLEKEKVVAENSNLLREIYLLEEKLSFKEVEMKKQKELNDKLQQTIDTKSSDIISKQRLLRQFEERLLSLLTNTRELEEERCQLKEELKQKNEYVNKRKVVQEEILKYANAQAKKVLKMEELLQLKENESKNLEMKLENVEACLNELRIKFGMKTIELEDCKKLQEKLVQQNDVNISVLAKKDQLLSMHEKEKASHLSRLKYLENSTELLAEKQKIESKDTELLAEKQKRRDLLNAYKSLKSQYNFLCARSGLNAENTPVNPKVEVETEPHNPDVACKNLLVAGETKEIKKISSNCNSEKEKIVRSNLSAYAGKEAIKVKKEMESGSDSSEDRNGVLNQPSISAAASKWKTSRNSSSSAGGKRSRSEWRGTRSRLAPNELDPHDDFLDTPLENIRGNLVKAVGEEGHKIPAPVSRDTECGYSDEETEEVDINVDDEVLQQQQQQQSLKRSPNGFKYVEPVRKKAQREALKGIECKQCKKFYDAVLPNGEDKDTGDGKKGFRCEHLDGVSRHRYRFAPPMTPEGFWNIGFDSET